MKVFFKQQGFETIEKLQVHKIACIGKMTTARDGLANKNLCSKRRHYEKIAIVNTSATCTVMNIER